jgi:hypothetical protein
MIQALVNKARGRQMKKEGMGRWRIHPRVAVVALIFGLAMNLACRSNDLQEGLSAKFSTNKAEYGQGEAIQLQLLLRNDSEDPLTLTFASSQKYDFWVLDSGGNEVWRWSASRVFLAVITEVGTMPGATIAYAESWGQLNNDGAAVPPGPYTLHAGIVIADAPRIDPVTIVIR